MTAVSFWPEMHRVVCLVDVGGVSKTSNVGVGHRRDPPVYLKPGDVLELEITGNGILRNTVMDETEVHLY